MTMQGTEDLLGQYPIIGLITTLCIYLSTNLLTINLYDLHIPHLIVEIIDIIGKSAIAVTAILTLRGWFKNKK
jgi:uncharacterized membrane protein YccC